MIDSNTPLFWRATLALCMGSFLVFANIYITQPLLPLFSDTFDLTPLEASWSFSLTRLNAYGYSSKKAVELSPSIVAIFTTGLANAAYSTTLLGSW